MMVWDPRDFSKNILHQQWLKKAPRRNEKLQICSCCYPLDGLAQVADVFILSLTHLSS